MSKEVYVIRELEKEEITLEFLKNFNRSQKVTHCWRKEYGEWVIKEIAFTEQWSQGELSYAAECLRGTVEQGGVVLAALCDDRLLAFASVEAKKFGPWEDYVELSSIHVTADERGHGLGRSMFEECVKAAKQLGAKKLYISSHSSVESQAFYMKMGCQETSWYHPVLWEKEPCDCQLEYIIEKQEPIQDVYVECPDVEGPTMILSRTKMEDAQELLPCYCDEKAVPFFNSDNCGGDDFHYTTLQRMEEAIEFWEKCYREWHAFVRYTIRQKETGEVIGTIEMLHRISEDIYNHYGVLRIDVASQYEKKDIIEELLYLVNATFYDVFQVDKIITKAIPEDVERIKALKACGFQEAKYKLLDKYGDYYCRERKIDKEEKSR